MDGIISSLINHVWLYITEETYLQRCDKSMFKFWLKNIYTFFLKKKIFILKSRQYLKYTPISYIYKTNLDEQNLIFLVKKIGADSYDYMKHIQLFKWWYIWKNEIKKEPNQTQNKTHLIHSPKKSPSPTNTNTITTTIFSKLKNEAF